MAKRVNRKQVAVEPEEKAPEEPVLVIFEDFLATNDIHPGLVASFKYEAKVAGDTLIPRTSEEWNTAFEAQSNRQYSN